MDTLRDELDRSFGDGPPLPPVDVRVRAGRRALRRRRVAGGAAGLAAVTVLLTGWHAASTDDAAGPDGFADDPTPAVTPSATEEVVTPGEEPWPRGELVRYVDGELEVRSGVVVHERIRNPFDYQPPGLSDALDLTWKGTRQWLIIENRPGQQGSLSVSTPSNGWASFADYVADQADPSVVTGWPDTFQLDDRGRVVPTSGTTVFDRTDDPRLGPDFAPPGAATGAAVVSVAGEEGNYFVVWRVLGGRLDVLTTPPDDIVGATFEELLSGARERYASGEGLR